MQRRRGYGRRGRFGRWLELRGQRRVHGLCGQPRKRRRQHVGIGGRNRSRRRRGERERCFVIGRQRDGRWQQRRWCGRIQRFGRAFGWRGDGRRSRRGWQRGSDAPGLVWKTGSKTNFTSYPDPGSEECIKYSGCMYEGEFAACNKTEPLAWVMSHDIVAVFPDLGALKLHDLCLKSGTKTIVVTAIDTCGDSDCDGCCTKNKGSADELIDVESFTNARWGVPDGRIQWADLGPTKSQGCQ